MLFPWTTVLKRDENRAFELFETSDVWDIVIYILSYILPNCA